ncbi:MAG: hypothetical protein HC884_04175 [Chloroflexaceae bacterium]|nr:hypothetical protein [Chloroflexaceae bacterium]
MTEQLSLTPPTPPTPPARPPMPAPPPIRRRWLIAMLVGLACFVGCALVRVHTPPGASYDGDIWFPLCAANLMLAGEDPYGGPCTVSWKGVIYPSNPLTTVLVVFPLLPWKDGIAGPFFIGLSSTLLAAGLLRGGEWWRLLAFLSAPYWSALVVVQWSPLLLALLYFPALLPLALAKPHVGLPVFLMRFTLFRALMGAIFVLLTLLIDPSWPLRWLPQTRSYGGYIPLLVFPIGLVLLAALWRWRHEQARFLLLMSLVPQRGFYDALLLWYLPRTPGQMVGLTLASWIGYAAVGGGVSIPFLVVGSIYGLALLLVLTSRGPEGVYPQPLTSDISNT